VIYKPALHVGGRPGVANDFGTVWLQQFSRENYLMNIDSLIAALVQSGESIPSNSENKNLLTSLGLSYQEISSHLQITPPLELFDKDAILSQLPCSLKLNIFRTISSTNDYLMGKIDHSDFNRSICLSEHQSAGRGRRGRKWISPFGRNIYLSFGCQIPQGIGIAGLSLVIGMQVAKSLRDVGLAGVELKWPNDVLLDDGKLAGILIEVGASKEGKLPAVIGVGINLAMEAYAAEEIEQKWSQAGARLNVSRNELAIRLITNIIAELESFSLTGFGPYQDAWSAFNAHFGKAVNVIMGDILVEGVDQGVDAKGNLVLKTISGTRSFNAGEVSLRRAEKI
jgi:BirA family biotin operon repressor/biotin-[acetyl-CoA-carboxylase] ligase